MISFSTRRAGLRDIASEVPAYRVRRRPRIVTECTPGEYRPLPGVYTRPCLEKQENNKAGGSQGWNAQFLLTFPGFHVRFPRSRRRCLPVIAVSHRR